VVCPSLWLYVVALSLVLYLAPEAAADGPIAPQAEEVILAEPFPLPAGTPTADDLLRQTEADVLRKSYGCLNSAASIATAEIPTG
jgi:hypothetical protein